MKNNKKLVALVCTLLLLVGAAGATLAWLTDQTQTVTNTFTSSDINITLEETTEDYQMVPGNKIAKDPKVTVLGGSEACWLFVEVTKSTNKAFDDYMTYGVRDGWTELEDGVYYREVAASADAQPFYILSEGEGDYAYGYVTVKGEVTKEMMEAIDGIVVTGQNATAEDEIAARPTLSFTAYAVQKANVTTAADAWAKAKALPTN